MKLRITFLLISVLLALQALMSQSTNEIFGKRNEVYFSFQVQSRNEISTITRIISIDNVKDNTVYAYANMEQFLKFSKMGYNINLLPHPGDAPEVVMKDHITLSPLTTWNYYPTYDAYVSIMNQFASSYPNICSVQTIATLASGRKLMVVKISDNVATDEAEPEFLYTSSIHGDETTGYILMLHLIDYLTSNYGTNSEVTDLVNNMEIYINPLANPDGTYAGGNSTVSGATRANANGVDMNRNYPDPQDGQHPDGNAWQPETVAFMDFATQHHFVTSCNFHGGAEVVNYPWDTWATLNADDNWWQYVSHEYADTAKYHATLLGNSSYLTSVTTNGITNGYAWYEVNGGRQDYMNYYQHCREVTIELSNTKTLAASNLLTWWEYNWRSLILYMKEARYGIQGIITDQNTGLPVAAQVYISGHDNLNTEVYSSVNLGDYHRPIKAGTYTLTVSASNYQTKIISNVVVTDHALTSLDIQLTPVTTPSVITLAASSITSSTAVLNGTVNPNGFATTYHFEWGTTTSYGNSTTTTSAGSGTSVVAVNASISGLTTGVTYHFKLVATNPNGTNSGSDMSFTTTCGTISAFPWTEGFENAGSLPTCWTQEQVSSSGIYWTFITGSGSNHPSAAHGGTYNACLKDNTAADNKTRLITPSLNISSLGSPTLTFWHTQAIWSGDQDQLIVYYRTSSSGTWTQLASYTASITAWTMETISLPYQSADYYINFEGNAKYGYGVCIDDVTVSGTTTPTLSVTPSNQNVTAAAGSTAFTVTSNSAWTVSSNQTWCTVTPSGSGNGTITATYAQNTTSSSRIATVTVTVTGLTPVTVTVMQAAPTLSVTPSIQSVTYAAGSTTFTLTSNSTWTCTSDQSWCVPTASGTGSGTITATYTANSLLISRVANLTVTVSGLTPIVVTVTQAGVPPTLAVSPSDQAVTPPAGSTNFTVTSNTTWTASSNQGWCTVTPSGSGNGTITASYTVNNTSSSRVASITVSATGATPVVVTVTQAAPTLGVTPSNQAVTNPAGNTSFTVTSNTNWTASSNQAWCTVTSSGSGNGTITATYTANTTYVSRVANVTVSVTGLTPVVVTVTQDPAPVPEFNYVIYNDVQTSDRTLEFDLYLLDTQPSTPFELSIIQAGILVSNNIINGGTISVSLVPGSSELNSMQAPTTVLWSTGASNGCIKLTPRTGPGCGSGTIISTSGYGTRVCRIAIANTVAFTSSSQANLTFNFTTSPYPTKVFQYFGTPCVSNQLTTSTTNCFSLASNPVLNGPPVLSVSPSDQPVTSASGSIPFTVTSNAAWTAISNQSWCTVTPSGFGNGTITAAYTENTGSSPRVASVTVTAASLTPIVVTVTQAAAPIKTVNLAVFLEGLYTGYGTMHPAQDETGDHWGSTVADKITIELHSGANYSIVAYTANNISLNTNGTASFTIPSAYAGNYYVTILNRNHILTTSANPVSFLTSIINYTFDAPSKAYGDNMELMIDGYYVFYGGDANQDGLVDGTDLSNIGNLADYATSGYLPEDINGDGLVDGTDLSMSGNNADFAIGAVTP